MSTFPPLFGAQASASAFPIYFYSSKTGHWTAVMPLMSDVGMTLCSLLLAVFFLYSGVLP